VRRFNSFKCVIPSDEPASGEESRDLLFDFFSGLFSRADKPFIFVIPSGLQADEGSVIRLFTSTVTHAV
jgi:hypothetical protein